MVGKRFTLHKVVFYLSQIERKAYFTLFLCSFSAFLRQKNIFESTKSKKLYKRKHLKPFIKGKVSVLKKILGNFQFNKGWHKPKNEKKKVDRFYTKLFLLPLCVDKTYSESTLTQEKVATNPRANYRKRGAFQRI